MRKSIDSSVKVFSVAFALVIMPTSINAALVGDLLVYYNFDGQTNDQAGNAGAAVLNGGATLTGSGFIGGALDTSGNGAAVVPAGAHLSAANTNDAMSVSFWQFNNQVKNSSTFWVHSPAAGANDRGFQAHVPWGNGTVFFDQSGCCNPAQRLTTVGTSLGVWQHFVFQRDSAGNREIWIDGFLAASAGGAETLDSFNGIITIGAEGNNHSNFFNGRIDEFAIWSAPLSQADIQSLAGGASTSSILFVPEPATATLGLIVAGTLLVRRRRAA